MNYKEVSRGLSQEEAEKYASGIQQVGSFVDSLQKQGLLPKRFAQVQGVTATKGEGFVIGTKQITDRHGSPFVFGSERFEVGLWLHDSWVYPDPEWNPGFQF